MMLDRRDFNAMVLAVMGGLLSGANLGCTSTRKRPRNVRNMPARASTAARG